MMRLALAFTVLLLAAAPAAARPPDASEMPTVKEVRELADAEIEARRVAAEEARKDRKMDLINAYMNGTDSTRLDEWKPIVGILTDDNEAEKYRLAAANAFRTRFKGLDTSNKQIAVIKKRIGNALLPYLNHREEQVRIWIHGVFASFWPGTAGNLKFKPEGGTYRARQKAWRAWKEFLK